MSQAYVPGLVLPAVMLKCDQVNRCQSRIPGRGPLNITPPNGLSSFTLAWSLVTIPVRLWLAVLHLFWAGCKSLDLFPSPAKIDLLGSVARQHESFWALAKIALAESISNAAEFGFQHAFVIYSWDLHRLGNRVDTCKFVLA